MLSLVVTALLAVQQPPPPPPDTTKRDTLKIKLDSLPLRTTREVSFETTEGTWISLDVAPDGQTIVFELLGDLYTMPIAGGTATRITSGPAFDSQPRYSPDGKQIVFLSDRNGSENVWLCDSDGRNTKAVTKGDRSLFASPEWTPDGQYIVVSKTQMPLGSTYELWLMHKDGGSGISITKDDRGFAPGQPGRTGTNALGAAFGPDARYIWYARHRGGFGYNLTFPKWEIAIQDRQTGRVYNQTDLYGGAMRPVLSPDGKWLVYVTRYDAETGIRLRNLQTGDERWLVYPVQRDDQESRFTRDLYPGSSFTPDSKALIVSYGGKIWRVDVPSGTATNIPFKAQVQQSLGPLVRTPVRVDTGDVLIHQNRNATPSPDGRRLAFSAFDRLYVMDLPNGTPRRVTTDSVQEQVPAWSPDGQWLAYVTWTEQGGALSKVRSTGGKPVRLSVDTSYYDAPVWSPDGRRIVVIKGPRRPKLENHQAPGYEIAWLPATGGATPRVSPTSFSGRPHFTRNPDRVYIYEGNEGLVSMRWDGTDRRVHARITGYTIPLPQAEPFPASEVQISPDSSQVIAQASNYVYLVALPLVGGTPVAINVSDPSSASFPVKKLTRVGGDFVGWSADAKSVYWSIGRTFFRHDIAAADSAEKPKARADSLRADSLKSDAFKALPDSVQKRLRSRHDSLTARCSARYGGAAGRAHHIDEGRRRHRKRRSRRDQQPHRVGRAARRRSCRCARDRRVGQDDHPRLRGHSRAPLAGVGHSRESEVAVPREPRLWRDHGPRSADRDDGHPDVRRSHGDGRDHGATALLHGPRRVRRVPRGELHEPRRRAADAAPLQRVLPRPHHQAVHGGESEAAAMGHHGGEGAGPDAHHRGDRKSTRLN